MVTKGCGARMQTVIHSLQYGSTAFTPLRSVQDYGAFAFLLLTFNSYMFIGEYKHNLDDKGRLAIPAKFRALLKNGAVVTRGIDNCLFLYSKKEWAELAKKIAGLGINKSNDRAFARLMLAGAMDVAFDNQGRIILPEYLRKFAGLKKKTIIAGLYNRLEIWDERVWNKYKTGTEKKSSTIAEALGELGV